MVKNSLLSEQNERNPLLYKIKMLYVYYNLGT